MGNDKIKKYRDNLEFERGTVDRYDMNLMTNSETRLRVAR